jgi:MFS family permease
MSPPAEHPAETTETRSLWHDRRFRTFWAGETISQFGDRITELALPLIAVLELEASAAQVGLLTAAVWLPNLLSLFVGSWVDHQLRKRRLMIVADVARSALLLTVPVAWALDSLTITHLYAVALTTGAAAVLFNTSYPSFFVSLVTQDAFLEANSKLSTSRSASYIVGPAVGGGLVQLLTAPVAVVVDAATFVCSAFFIGQTKVADRTPDSTEGVPVWRRAVTGVRYVVRHPYLRYSLGCATTVNFFTFMSAALIVLFASETLDLSPGAIGLAFGIGATGSLVGAIIAPRLSHRFGLGHNIVAGAVLFPLPILIAAAATGPQWLTGFLLALTEFLSGMGVMLFDVNLNSLQASVIPDEMRSRVAGAFSTINYGVRPFGSVIGGLLGTWLGLRPTLVISAIGGALCVLWLLASPIPRVRRLDELEPAESFR